MQKRAMYVYIFEYNCTKCHGLRWPSGAIAFFHDSGREAHELCMRPDVGEEAVRKGCI